MSNTDREQTTPEQRNIVDARRCPTMPNVAQTTEPAWQFSKTIILSDEELIATMLHYWFREPPANVYAARREAEQLVAQMIFRQGREANAR